MKNLSRTATKIARFMVLLDAVPRLRGVLPDGAAATAEQILRASGAVPARHVDMMRSTFGLRLYEWAERLTGRGQVLWFGVRKRWVAQCVEDAIRDGAQQLLVLGAGMDPLAVMVAERHPDVLCMEIDAPATATPKAIGVKNAGLARPNHIVCPVDLSKSSLADALKTTLWRKDSKSIVVAEGLLMYLAPADVDEFFRAVRDNTGPLTRLAFTVLATDDRGQPYFGPLSTLIRFSLRLAGEPLRWALHPREISAYLDARGWREYELPTLVDLRKRFLATIGAKDEPLRPYDYLVLAEMANAVEH